MNDVEKIIKIALSDVDSIENIEFCYTIACHKNLVDEFESKTTEMIKEIENFLIQKVEGFKIENYFEYRDDENFKYMNELNKLDDLFSLGCHERTVGVSARRGLIAFNCGKHPAQQKQNNSVTDKSS